MIRRLLASAGFLRPLLRPHTLPFLILYVLLVVWMALLLREPEQAPLRAILLGTVAAPPVALSIGLRQTSFAALLPGLIERGRAWTLGLALVAVAASVGWNLALWRGAPGTGGMLLLSAGLCLFTTSFFSSRLLLQLFWVPWFLVSLVSGSIRFLLLHAWETGGLTLLLGTVLLLRAYDRRRFAAGVARSLPRWPSRFLAADVTTTDRDVAALRNRPGPLLRLWPRASYRLPDHSIGSWFRAFSFECGNVPPFLHWVPGLVVLVLLHLAFLVSWISISAWASRSVLPADGGFPAALWAVALFYFDHLLPVCAVLTLLLTDHFLASVPQTHLLYPLSRVQLLRQTVRGSMLGMAVFLVVSLLVYLAPIWGVTLASGGQLGSDRWSSLIAVLSFGAALYPVTRRIAWRTSPAGVVLSGAEPQPAVAMLLLGLLPVTALVLARWVWSRLLTPLPLGIELAVGAAVIAIGLKLEQVSLRKHFLCGDLVARG